MKTDTSTALLTGMLMGVGSIEINHHWLEVRVYAHGGWTGLALLLSGLGLFVAILVTEWRRRGG